MSSRLQVEATELHRVFTSNESEEVLQIDAGEQIDVAANNIRGLLRSKGILSDHDLDDLVQETWLLATKYASGVINPESFMNWLTTTSINVRNDFVKKKIKQRMLFGDGEGINEPVSAEMSGAEILVQKEKISSVQLILERLKPMDREILELFYLQGKSIKRIAKELQKELGTIKRRLHVARHRFQVEMEKTDNVEIAV